MNHFVCFQCAETFVFAYNCNEKKKINKIIFNTRIHPCTKFVYHCKTPELPQVDANAVKDSDYWDCGDDGVAV
jgi:hypothetical protein